MTLQELERGFELHEKRLARIEEVQKITGDNLLVQGELLNRVDQRLDRVVSIAERNAEDMSVMQSAMTNLFQRMDAFIRGLERHDGHGEPSSS